MYELKSSRKSTRNKKIVARIKQQLIKRQEFFCVYFRVILCYHSHNRKVKSEKSILFRLLKNIIPKIFILFRKTTITPKNINQRIITNVLSVVKNGRSMLIAPNSFFAYKMFTNMDILLTFDDIRVIIEKIP